MKENKKFIPIWLYIFGGFVISAFIVIETCLAISNGKSFSFDNYDGTFRVTSFFMVIIAIILTYKRMKQTKHQIDVMTDNNKFNNFYKHRDMFNDSLRKTEIIKIIGKYSDASTNQLLNNYYRSFYETDYKEFAVKISNKGKKKIDEFIESLRNSEINTELSYYKSDDIHKIFLDEELKVHIFDLGNAIDNILKNKNEWGDMIDKKMGNYKLITIKILLNIYFSYYIIFETISFDGKEKFEKYILQAFKDNVTRIFKHNNLTEILIPSLKS